MADCVIYGLKARGAEVYFYVGSSQLSASGRLKQHWYGINRNGNRRFVHKMRQIGRANVVVDMLELVNPKTRFEREYDWIQRLMAEGHPLTNSIVALPVYPVRLLDPQSNERNIRRLRALKLDGPAIERRYGPAIREAAEALLIEALKIVDCILSSPEECAVLGVDYGANW